MNAFVNAGFTSEGIREPMPSPTQVERYPSMADNLRVPELIIYLLRRPSQMIPGDGVIRP